MAAKPMTWAEYEAATAEAREEEVQVVKLTVQERAQIVVATDLHIGAQGTYARRFRRQCEWLAIEPDCWMVLLGDSLNCNLAGSVGLKEEEVCALRAQRRLAAQVLHDSGADRKLLGIMTGNHEFRMPRQTDSDYDPAHDLADDLGVPFWGYETWLQFRVRREHYPAEVYPAYFHHGAGGGQSPGAALNKLGQIIANKRVELACMGHTHGRMGKADVLTYLDADGQRQRTDQYLVIAGTYQGQTKGDYARRRGYREPAIGAASVWLSADKHDIHVRI